jgi:hypothetical protein
MEGEAFDSVAPIPFFVAARPYSGFQDILSNLPSSLTVVYRRRAPSLLRNGAVIMVPFRLCLGSSYRRRDGTRSIQSHHAFKP